jgi:hypothetical protein
MMTMLATGFQMKARVKAQNEFLHLEDFANKVY